MIIEIPDCLPVYNDYLVHPYILYTFATIGLLYTIWVIISWIRIGVIEK